VVLKLEFRGETGKLVQKSSNGVHSNLLGGRCTENVHIDT